MTVADDAQPLVSSPTLLARLGSLGRRHATWVLIDQGVVSLGNFLTGLFLTRALAQTEYGAYQVLFDTMLYLNSLQNALIIYPLLIKGATGDRTQLGRLATASIILTLGLLPLLGGATIASIGVLHNWHISIAAVLALLLWQVQETLRRALMSDLRFADAVWGDAVRNLGQAALIILLARHHALDLNRAFIIMAITSMAGSLLQAWQIGLKPIRPWELRMIARDFWRLGRWMLLTNASTIITTLGYSWTLLATHGKEANAIFGAIGQAFKLANPIMSSMGGLITPAVARAAATVNMKAATRMAIRYTALGAGLLLPYFIVLIVLATPLLRWLSTEGKNYYLYANLLRLFVANYTATYLMSSIGAWLAGLGRSRYIFYVQIVNIVASVLVGLPLVALFGVPGLIVGGLVAAMLSTVAAGYYIYKLAHVPHPVYHSPGNA